MCELEAIGRWVREIWVHEHTRSARARIPVDYAKSFKKCCQRQGGMQGSVDV